MDTCRRFDVVISRGSVLLLLIVQLTITACSKAPPEAPPPPPTEVSVITLQARTVPVRYEWVAQTNASRTVEIRARVPGFLTRRPFEEGGPIDEGDLLFQIDQRNYQADLEIARARVAQAEAARALAAVTLSRIETAAKLGGTNEQEVDEKRARLQEADASVRLAKGNLSNAELNLSYTTIVSPLIGKIGKSPVYEGAYVDAGANSLLATVVQSDPIYVEFSVSEREILDWQLAVKEGRIRREGAPEMKGTPEEIRAARRKFAEESKVKVAITLIDGEKFAHLGEVNFIDVEINPQTGTAQVRAVVPNPEQRLVPGQFVKASMLGWERPDAIAIPQRALLQQPTGQYVYTVTADDTVELKRVISGQWIEEEWVIESGLEPGERVIVDGMIKVRPGATVKPVPYTETKAAATNQEKP